MSVIADEYADDIIAGADKRAFLMEHAKVILDDKAIESLAQRECTEQLQKYNKNKVCQLY